MYTVVGIVHSKGEFNGNSYDNFNLHCVRDAKPDTEENGQITEVIKVKSELFLSSDIDVGSIVTPYYDKYGRIVQLIVN
jgi:hypothetical protein